MFLTLDDDVLSRVKERILLRGQINLFGSQLGALIKAEIPSLNFKQFGGLRHFCAKYLVGVVTYLGQSSTGSDDLYSVQIVQTQLSFMGNADISISASASLQTTFWIPVREPPTEDLWSGFASISNQRRIAFSPASGELVVSADASAPLPDGYTEISSITPDELRSAVESFVPLAPEACRPTLVHALGMSPSSYYAQWLTALRTAGGNDLIKRWTAHRIAYICSAFTSRISASGGSMPQQQHATELLRQSQNAAHIARKRSILEITNLSKISQSGIGQEKQSESNPPKSAVGYLSSTDLNDEQFLRQLVTVTIREMSPDQLRNLNLPLGLVIDAIRANR